MTATTTPAPLDTGQQGRTLSASMAHCDPYSGFILLVNHLFFGELGPVVPGVEPDRLKDEVEPGLAAVMREGDLEIVLAGLAEERADEPGGVFLGQRDKGLAELLEGLGVSALRPTA